MYPEEYYEEIAQQRNAELQQWEYESYIEDIKIAQNAAEDYYNKYLNNAETTRQSWIDGFVIGWINKR